MLEPGQQVERYEIVRLIGEGGMAKVYLARHTTLNTLHAVKVLTMTGPSLKDRLVAEGRVQAGLRHENIVRVSDVLEVDGMPALVMDYVDGPDLAHWIVTERPDPVLAEEIFRGIVAGVRVAHEAGVAHRDLKPANVLMSRESDRWVPKVSDFGLVKALQGDNQTWKTRSGLPMGTPQYMAPEQIRDAANVDHRADLFSLGCILYELLAHHPAYNGADILEIFERVRSQDREALPASAPAHLDHAVSACLELDPLQRPRDCATLVSLLQSGPPPTRPPRVASWAVGAGAAAALGAAAMLAGVIGVGGLLWWAGRPAPTPGGCPTTAGLLGYVRAPTVFLKPVGSRWAVPRDVDVFEAVPADDEDPAVVCVLTAGSELLLVEPPSAGWIPVHGDAIGAPGAPQEEEPAPLETDCPDVRSGDIVGYVNIKLFAPSHGASWRPTASKTLYSDYPREENGFRVDGSMVVCTLPAGVTIEVEEAPIRVRGTGTWVPIVGGSWSP